MTKPKKALLEISRLLNDALDILQELETNEELGNRKATLRDSLTKLNDVTNDIGYLEGDWDNW